MKLFKIDEEDEEYVKISEELKDTTQTVKQIALSVISK